MKWMVVMYWRLEADLCREHKIRTMIPYI